jgi:threonine aldolase
VDALSFGATKGGALGAEAILFFDPVRAAGMSERRKRGGHLISKHRFIAAQMEAYLADDLWLKLARHANSMADRLAQELTAAGFPPIWPVEANEVFVLLPQQMQERLQAAGAGFYSWTTAGLPQQVAVSGDASLVRLVTSFATQEREIEDFIGALRAANVTTPPKLRPNLR